MSWDTIVIGSGIGGLTAAVALARAGQRVIVLEQHYLPGGWTHSFTLEGYSFSPGVHYLGEAGEGRHLRQLFEGLGLTKQLSLWELNPEGFDHLIIGGEQIDVPKGRERWVARLVARFPEQKEAIERYFATVAAISGELQRADEQLGFPRVLALPFRAKNVIRWGLSTLDSLFDGCGIDDPMLRAVLSARCGNHGLAPSRVSAVLHAAMINHYFEGAYYPRGGARKITSAFVKELRRNGGEIALRTTVSKILVERGRAVGVELEGGERLFARTIVSNADAALTYERLLPEEYGRLQRRRARRMTTSTSCLSLFAAVDADLRSWGYDSGNYWWYRSSDVGGIYERMERAMPRGVIDGIFVSVSSLKDPGHRPHGHDTLEMFTFLPYDPFERWKDSRTGDRDPEYLALKRSLEAQMIAAAEEVIPGLSERLVMSELGTPLTNDFYCATKRGGCYGTAKTPFQVGPFSFSTRSPVENLFLCGASTLAHGVAGASTSGLFVAQAILGLARPEQCLAPADGTLRISPADAALAGRPPRPERSRVRPLRHEPSLGDEPSLGEPLSAAGAE